MRMQLEYWIFATKYWVRLKHNNITFFVLNFYDIFMSMHMQEGRMPLVLACYNGRNDIIHLLLDHGANVDFSNTVWQQCYYNVIAKIWSSIRCIQSEFGDSPLIGASRYGHVSTCQLLIDQGATVDYQHKVRSIHWIMYMTRWLVLFCCHSYRVHSILGVWLAHTILLFVASCHWWWTLPRADRCNSIHDSKSGRSHKSCSTAVGLWSRAWSTRTGV